MKSPHNSEELRHRISALCHEIGQVLGVVNTRLAADSSFVFTAEYSAIKNDLRLKNAELKKLKTLRHLHQHCYSVLVQGDVFRNGEVIRNCPLNYELTSVIDCNLGDQTRLNKTEGSHNALWNLICAKVGSFFVQKKFSVHHIVQLR